MKQAKNLGFSLSTKRWFLDETQRAVPWSTLRLCRDTLDKVEKYLMIRITTSPENRTDRQLFA